MVVVLEKYLMVCVFQQWVKIVLWFNSWVNIDYNGVNSFCFIVVDGSYCYVCWSMCLQVLFVVMIVEQCVQVGLDYLVEEFGQWLVQGLVCWDMWVIIVEDGDLIDDFLQVWFVQCCQVKVGMFSLVVMQLQVEGVCCDFNYDLLILFSGIVGLDDLILVVWLVVYLQFFNCCECEIVNGKGVVVIGRECG